MEPQNCLHDQNFSAPCPIFSSVETRNISFYCLLGVQIGLSIHSVLLRHCTNTDTDEVRTVCLSHLFSVGFSKSYILDWIKKHCILVVNV